MVDGADGGDDRPLGDQSVTDPGEVRHDALAAEAHEIRRIVDAGAGSPEELRALAARLREHRQREDALWRTEVKPTLQKQGRGRLRRQPAPPLPPPILLPPSAAVPPASDRAQADDVVGAGPGPVWIPAPATVPGSAASRSLWVGLGLLAMVALALIAASTSVWILLVPLVALLVWAWSQGRQDTGD